MHMKQENVVTASLWMIVITLSLFFLPFFSGVFGGMAGGYLAGGWRRGLVAGVVPAVVIAFGMWFLLTGLDAPGAGVGTARPAGAMIAAALFGLFAGAALGGWIAQTGKRRTERARHALGL